MKNKVKIAQIIGKTCNGGVESFVYNYFLNIDRDRFEFHFYVEGESKIINKKKIEELGGKVIFIPSYFHIFKYLKCLTKNFRMNKYDIVHSNMNSLSLFPLYCAKKTGCKVRIAHSHSMSNRKEVLRNFVKNILKLFSKAYATHYFACSVEAGKWLFGKKIIHNKNFFIIKNSVDVERFYFSNENRVKIRSQFNILDGDILLGNVGRFVKQKNHLFAIDLIYKLKRKGFNNYKLLLVGEGPLIDKYYDIISEKKLEDNIIIVPSCNNVNEFYSAFDIFLFPSLYEGLGIVLVEAQINGLCCLISNNIPNESVFTDNVIAIGLNESSQWLDEIIKNSCKHRNGTNFDNLIPYDIRKSSKELSDIYLKILL